MKKLTSLLLALVLCLSLSAPALADDPGTLEAGMKNILWTSEVMDKSGLAEQDFFVKEEMKITSHEFFNYPDELDGYIAVTKDNVFTVKHNAPKDDGTYITVEGYVFEWVPEGTYPEEESLNCVYNGENGPNGELMLLKNFGYITGDDATRPEIESTLDGWPPSEEHYVQLKAGQSAQFSLASATIPDGALICIRVKLHNPKTGGGVYTQSFFKIDEAAVKAALEKKPETGTAFTDVAANSPYLDAIRWAVEKDITKGTTATTFGPNKYCTVRQILTFLWRANGKPGAGGDERASVTAWAKKLGLQDVESNVCTRATAVSYLWKVAGSPKASKTVSFSDVPANASYAEAVSWAVEKGITSGKTANTFAPNDSCTRGQIVTFLYRASK